MFIHQAGPQALVQYSHLYDSIRAKGELEKFTFMLGSRRYAFEVQFSKLKELVIHKNNNYSRDFRLYPIQIEDSKGSFDNCADMSEGILHRDFSQSSGSDELDGCCLSSSSTASEIAENDSFGSVSSSPQLQESTHDFDNSESIHKSSHQSSHQSSHHSRHSHHSRQSSHQNSHHGLISQDHSSLYSGVSQFQQLVGGYDSSLKNEYGLGVSSSSLGYNAMNHAYHANCHLSDMIDPSSFTLFPSSYSRDSDLSLKEKDLHTEHSSSFPQEDSFGLSSLGFNNPSRFTSEYNVIRRYVLTGFRRQLPISDLVDLLYGIDIKYAEYMTECSGAYTVIVFGRSEWSDAMLTSYLNSNPVDGQTILLRGPSEVVH